eukprot:5365307-Alexandrium_andersonii.AAC.1
MSASLVGSEMCIRDRCAGHPRRRAPLTTAWKPAQVGGPFSCGSGADPRTCLLYTSDAADDM